MLTVTADGTAISRISLPLLPETAERLRKQFPVEQDEQWVLGEARDAGWVQANRSYLSWQRERGQAEMQALVEALAISIPPSPRIATELVALGYELFMLPRGFRGGIERLTEDTIQISVAVCPVFEKLERTNWKGVTACGSWHHRQGWYDAMQMETTDSLIAEEKWGDAACVCEVTFLPAPGAASQREMAGVVV